MTVVFVLLLFATVNGFAPPKIHSQNHSFKNDPEIGDYIELSVLDTLELHCYGKFDGLEFKPPNLDSHLGYDKEDFQSRFKQILLDDGEQKMILKNLKVSDTGRYECISIDHPDISESVYVFVNGGETFLPLTDNAFTVYPENIYVPCKTTKFVEKGNVMLEIDSAPVRNAKDYFRSDTGFKLVPEMYDTLDQTMCRCIESKGEDVIYIITETIPQEDIDDKFELGWEESIAWPYVGAAYKIGCKLSYKGRTKYQQFFLHRLEVSCPRCHSEHSDVTIHNSIYTTSMTAVIRNIDIANLTLEDSGKYLCTWSFEYRQENKTITKEVQVSPTKEYIRILNRTSEVLSVREGEPIILHVAMTTMPAETDEKPTAKWIRKYTTPISPGEQSESLINGGALSITSDQSGNIFFERLRIDGEATFTNMSGTYLLQVEYVETILNIEWQVAVKNEKGVLVISVREPSEFVVLDQQFYPPGTHLHVDCLVESLPPADVIFQYKRHNSDAPFVDVNPNELDTVSGTFENGFVWNKTIEYDVDVQCSAEKSGKHFGTMTKTIQVANGKPNIQMETIKSERATSRENPQEIFEGDQIKLSCVVPKHEGWNVRWEREGQEVPSSVIQTDIEILVNAEIENVKPRDSGHYVCIVGDSGAEERLVRDITINKVSVPYHKNTDPRKPVYVAYNEDTTLECNLIGYPLPDYTWKKDGKLLENRNVNETGNLSIFRARKEDAGEYECVGTNRAGSTSRSVYVKVTGVPSEGNSSWWYLSLIFIILISLIAFLFLYRKHKRAISLQKRTIMLQKEKCKELYDQLVGKNQEAEPESYKKLPIDQRLERLCYNKDYEIDIDNMKIDTKHVLGKGNFGVVYKGVLSRSPVSDEAVLKDTLQVAVKAPLHLYSEEQLKMLSDELKVLCAIGNHPNVLSLVGAVVKNMEYGRLLVVVEFCENGNLRNYLRKNSSKFIDELRAGDNGGYLAPNSLKKAYAAETDGKWEQERLLDDNKVLCTSDLISFTMQIASGMEYLASLPCLHRDLAARNVLLTSNNICRVADFGMAKNIMKNDYYKVKKSKNQDVPVRWMSIEAINKMKYTQQSDVWAFAITMYEIFTLGGSPYPGVTDDHIVDHIVNGNKNPKPKFCHQDLYELMLQCWEVEPSERPRFSQCVQYLKQHMKLASPMFLETLEADIQKEAAAQKQLKTWLVKEEDSSSLAQYEKEPFLKKKKEEGTKLKQLPLPPV